MQHIVCALAILLLISIAPKQYSEKPEEKVPLMMEMQKLQEKESVKPENDHSGNDFSIHWSVIDISGI
jgi:hypothetical protein